MSRNVDLELINSRSREREKTVQDAKFFETLEGEGRSPEGIKAAARKILGLPDDGIVLLEANNIMKDQNKKIQAFVVFLNSASKIKDVGILTEEETTTIEEIEGKLSRSLCETFNIELEDLYKEGE